MHMLSPIPTVWILNDLKLFSKYNDLLVTRAVMNMVTELAAVCTPTPTSMITEPMKSVARRPKWSDKRGANGRPCKRLNIFIFYYLRPRMLTIIHPMFWANPIRPAQTWSTSEQKLFVWRRYLILYPQGSRNKIPSRAEFATLIMLLWVNLRETTFARYSYHSPKTSPAHLPRTSAGEEST